MGDLMDDKDYREEDEIDYLHRFDIPENWEQLYDEHGKIDGCYRTKPAPSSDDCE